MAIKNIKDLLKESTVVLDGKYLQARTVTDGFTGTYQGNHSFKVEKTGSNYSVYPMYFDKDTKQMEKRKDPIIYTDDGEIFFVVRTTVDPYNYPVIEQDFLTGKNTEKQILQAFIAFSADEYSFANYNLFINDDLKFYDGSAIKEVQSIKFPNATETINSFGEDKTLTVIFTPADASDKTVTFTSSDESVIKVSNTGKLTGSVNSTEKSAVVTAETSNGKKATVTVIMKASELPEP
ncbi:hypothetical protein CKA15_162 [Listeria phage cka15]|nr:hypothetical protein CKA15_162 [Listeria phage cka15]